jgi:hypothetical protein
MRPKFRFILALVIACAAIVPATAIASATPLGQCTKIDERVFGTADLDFDADGTLLSAYIYGENVLGENGNVEGLQTVNKITPGGVLHFTGLNFYTDTDYGDFVATTSGIVTPGGKLIFSIEVVDGGPGRFSANGTFAVEFDAEEEELVGVWDVVYKGRICSS